MSSHKIAVCIPTSKERKPYTDELIAALGKQTFRNFSIYTVNDISPIGLAKQKVVDLALKDNPEFIQMIDSDDLVDPDFLKISYETITKENLDWVATWGRCIGTREGYIHSYDLPLVQHKALNRLPAWAMFRASIFKAVRYRKGIDFAEDWDLWLQIKKKGFVGRVIEQELYSQRWHDSNLNITKKYEYRKMRAKILKYNNIPDIKYRFHMMGYAHLPCSERYMGCAFTQKMVKLSKMLLSMGHEVYIYGAEGSDAPCTEFIQCVSLDEIRDEWGDGDNRFEIGYDWHNKGFRHDLPTYRKDRTKTTMKFYDRMVAEIKKRQLPDDFLLIMQGQWHMPVYERLTGYLKVEPGIGYRGSDPNNFRAFESSYIMDFSYGSAKPFESLNGSHYDRVIPNYFDPKDFMVGVKKKDYYLYIGRMISRKGIETAIMATQAIGAKLILVGQKDTYDVSTLPPHCQFLGYADREKRMKLMSEAIATFTPTNYLEPFAGTHIESMLSGTPVLTTNFGVFLDTVKDGVNGYKCDTLDDFVQAAIAARFLDPMTVRKEGERYLMDRVKLDFEKWWDDLYALYESTLGTGIKGWSRVRKEQPEWRKVITPLPSHT